MYLDKIRDTNSHNLNSFYKLGILKFLKSVIAEVYIEPEQAQAQGPNPGPRPQEPGPRHPWPGPKTRACLPGGPWV